MQHETIWQLGGVFSPAGLKTMTVINARNIISERTGEKGLYFYFFTLTAVEVEGSSTVALEFRE